MDEKDIGKGDMLKARQQMDESKEREIQKTIYGGERDMKKDIPYKICLVIAFVIGWAIRKCLMNFL